MNWGVNWEVARWLPLLGMIGLWSGIALIATARTWRRRDKEIVWEFEEIVDPGPSEMDKIAAQWVEEDRLWAEQQHMKTDPGE